MLKLPLPPSASRITQFKRPQKVICLLKIWSNSANLMNQIFYTFNSVFSQCVGNSCIIRQWNTRSVDFTVPAFVNEMTDGFEIGFPIGNVGLNNLEHFLCGFGEFDKDTIVNLKKTKELQNFSRFRSHFVDTIVNTWWWK